MWPGCWDGSYGDAVNFALPLSLVGLVLRFLPRGPHVTANGQEVDVAHLLTDPQESGAS